jgi:V-type H+-transporting ATPase subunit D
MPLVCLGRKRKNGEEKTDTVQKLDINSELDELDREEFYRLKKVSNKKQRDSAAQDAEILAKRKEQAQAEKENGAAAAAAPAAEEDQGTTADILGQEDEDVIF